jgi:hypothetical protein
LILLKAVSSGFHLIDTLLAYARSDGTERKRRQAQRPVPNYRIPLVVPFIAISSAYHYGAKVLVDMCLSRFVQGIAKVVAPRSFVLNFSRWEPIVGHVWR